MDIAILIIRVFFGLAIAAHGAGKLFRFAGHGLKATAGMFEMVGFRPGVPFAAAAGLTEFGGGILVILGLLTPFGAAGIVSTMIVAMMSMHVKNGFFAMNNGIELPFLYAVAAVAIAFSGGGAFSLDALLGLGFLHEAYVVTGALVLAVFGAVVTLSLRHSSASVPSKS
jgi:putative oxidoreductase